jgi:hypothetical protein
VIDIWLFDLDGTLCLKGERDPFGWDHVGEDLPNVPVVKIARVLLRGRQPLGKHPLGFLSGRPEQCRRQTTLWLLHHLVIPEVRYLWMRPDGDYRPDEVVKAEIYERDIKPYHVIEGVFDDRDKVVQTWRSIGLTCFQVADGDFLYVVITYKSGEMLHSMQNQQIS